ncbi:MAG: cyclophilin-like fold protein [Verrucomicrobiota bacterium JB022]|nr:cyclophilin-like fold protein [Verrucomicrobiota bacterium JB022]
MADSMKIRIDVGEKTLKATLVNTPAARDFLTLLPLTVALEDYAKTEKICDLPRKLSTQGAPAGYEPRAGDITYYAPWGNLAIFYRGFSYSSGLVHLGTIEGDLEALIAAGNTQVNIQRDDTP